MTWVTSDVAGGGLVAVQVQHVVAIYDEIIGDPTLGDAILDRAVHRSHRIELTGESLRKRQALAQPEGLTNAKQR